MDPQTNKKAVLVAVPDLIFRAKIKETARQVGHLAEAAPTPAAVIERAQNMFPDLIVIDLGDERIDPFDTIRHLKTDPTTEAIRILGFFPHVHTDQKNRAKEAGCDRVLPRSVFVANLASLLESLGTAPARTEDLA